MATDWSPSSWQDKPVHAQSVQYKDQNALAKVCDKLKASPPLVHASQIDAAREVYKQVALGKAFIVQGGDCAESFDDVQAEIIAGKVSLLFEQAKILEDYLGVPVATVGRLAGQYAKPRSNPYEKLADGSEVLAFRGHNVNGPDLSEREPDPQRLLLGHFHSAATLRTLNLIDLEALHPEDAGSSRSSLDGGRHSLDSNASASASADVFTSHEALHLPYEQSMTRGRYNTSATMIWIGERTRQLDGAHVEYIRGIANPLGVKFGPTTTAEEITGVLNALCPDKANSVGRVTIITRMGHKKVEENLPRLIKAVQDSGHKVVWMCDPCHGNTITVDGYKTRSIVDILEEIVKSWEVHQKLGSSLGGIHLEQTGETVSECIESVNSTGGLGGEDYKTLCDPRLSREQALLVVRCFGEQVKKSLSVTAAADRRKSAIFDEIKESLIEEDNKLAPTKSRLAAGLAI